MSGFWIVLLIALIVVGSSNAYYVKKGGTFVKEPPCNAPTPSKAHFVINLLVTLGGILSVIAAGFYFFGY